MPMESATYPMLLADSGSTKTEWALVASDGTVTSAFSDGLNPYYHTEESILAILREKVVPQLKTQQAARIYFYGAGCTGDERTQMLQKTLQAFFAAGHIEVYSDIVGSVRAVCGHQPGIAGILGTGANSCQYDGEKIVDNVPVLGFILGDEGSAGYFGRKVLQGYYYREMPAELKSALEAEFDMQRSTILENVYKKEQPNRYVAQFARFAGVHANHPYITEIFRQGFAECIDRHILKYKDAEKMPVGFVGSVAFHNADLLREVLAAKGLQAGNIIQNPIPNLIEFHKKA